MYGLTCNLVEEQPYVPQEVLSLQQQLQQVQGQFELPPAAVDAATTPV